MRAVGATWFTAVPAIHEILLDRSAGEHPAPLAPPLRFARSSSAPLNTATQRALERTLGVPLLSAYGMTEAAHQASSEPLPPPGTSKHGSVGRPTGTRIQVVDPSGQACPPGVQGEVWVRGPSVARVTSPSRLRQCTVSAGAGCAPGTWGIWTPTAPCSSPAGSGT